MARGGCGRAGGVWARAASAGSAPPAPSAASGAEAAPQGPVGGVSGVRLEGIEKAFRGNLLLRGVSWEVKRGERVGLVGLNGCGKTTQLRIITGEVEPDAGEVRRARENMHVACLSQEFDVDPARTVREEFCAAFGEGMAALHQLEALQTELEQPGLDMDRMAEVLDEMEAVREDAEDLDVAKIDAAIDKMMPSLGFVPEDSDRLVASYSGGWQMRMALGKILLQEPDLLLLDEPTNHLDLETVAWLETYLRGQEAPMVVVSHDREFLDNVCTKIVETERGEATTYAGNYSDYVAKKAEGIEAQRTAHERQQKEIARQVEMAQRLQGGGQAGRAEAAKKALTKLREEGTYIEKPFEFKKRPFTFPEEERCGQVVARIKGVTHGYGNKQLFEGVDLELDRGHRVALLGPNGAGKSTLLRLMMGTEEPLQGEARLGEHNVVPNYFTQNQAEELDLELTALETLVRAAPDARLDDIKALLGRMLFSGSGMERRVGALSGGEKARLALAKFMLTPATLLVLDEPTNHLDIPSKEVLEEALQCFQGAVVVASHDRYFLRRVANRIVEVKDRKLMDYKGDYTVFLESNDHEAEAEDVRVEEKKKKEQKKIKAKSKMSKAEKARLKKEKAKAFQANKKGGKQKNAGRWS